MGLLPIIYTLTDEAPALATYSLLPIIRGFVGSVGIGVETKDISLAARVLAQFPDALLPQQRVADALGELGELVKNPRVNIVKLPNISASLPQLRGVIAELQSGGYAVPDFPSPALDVKPGGQAEGIRRSYYRVLGSAVNPVLREGNSDRRVAPAVKRYAQKHPQPLGAWEQSSRSHVASMEEGDFYATEQSFVSEGKMAVQIVWQGRGGESRVLREGVELWPGDLVDGATMSCRALQDYFAREIVGAKQVKDEQGKGVLLSLHLKATMMKVSDPIIFGHGVRAYYREVFEQFDQEFSRLGIDAKNGMGDVYDKSSGLGESGERTLREVIAKVHGEAPPLAMVDSARGISHLHRPNHVIIDASMPVVIKNSGKVWGPDGELRDTKALIPDRCYGGIYQEVMDFCRRQGALDVSSMGTVSNVGLMARKAEEYGSHDRTFELADPGVVRVLGPEGAILMEHEVERGDIWRMCRTEQVAVRDWVKLAVERNRVTGQMTIFWLDSQRSHDARLIQWVEQYWQAEGGGEMAVMSPREAMGETLRRVQRGEDVIAVTGNVLRDYLTDLFPILELGTSARMLSIVPLLEGGGLYETGAGGSAPRHVQQFVQENHLRWDSLGEFLALGALLEDLALKTQGGRQNGGLSVMAKALEQAIEGCLEANRSPGRKVGELDTRGCHFYLALYWAEALARGEDPGLSQKFSPVYQQLQTHEAAIVSQLQALQGRAVDLGGYFWPDAKKVTRVMRPCQQLNDIIASI